MKKQFDDFKNLKMKEACKVIHDMTYAYINPETQLPTVVPTKHYENILNQVVEEQLDERIQLQMLNMLYKTVDHLRQEYGKDFYKVLICMDLDIHLSNMSELEKYCLDETDSFLKELQVKEKKTFHFLRSEVITQYQDLIHDQSLHAALFKNTDDEELN